MGDAANSDRSIQLLRSFQERLNRRIEKASKTLQGGLLRPEGTDPMYSPSNSESSTREQTPSAAGGTSSSREATPSSREITSTSSGITPPEGNESIGASSYESMEDGGKDASNTEIGGEKTASDQSVQSENTDNDQAKDRNLIDEIPSSLVSEINSIIISQEQSVRANDSSDLKHELENSIATKHSSLHECLQDSTVINGSNEPKAESIV